MPINLNYKKKIIKGWWFTLTFHAQCCLLLFTFNTRICLHGCIWIYRSLCFISHNKRRTSSLAVYILTVVLPVSVLPTLFLFSNRIHDRSIWSVCSLLYYLTYIRTCLSPSIFSSTSVFLILFVRGTFKTLLHYHSRNNSALLLSVVAFVCRPGFWTL